MEEESAVKAPVTRLRRRLSVEKADDVKSPGPGTPTKKRGGRLAAKPQLELIDEHGADVTPSKRITRKTSVKEAAENVEEKVVTPSRRSTRIKSNTSIVSETTQSFDSPRAKRAARRTSQVGSDSESSVTPVRQTRRTRKDSASSIDKLEITLSGKPQITEVIIEEENSSVKSDDTSKGDRNSPTTSIRKSPRLREKRLGSDGKSIDKSSSELEANVEIPVEEQLNTSKNKQKNERKSLNRSNNEENSANNVNTEEQLNISKDNGKKDRKSLVQSNTDGNLKNADVSQNQLNVSKQSNKKDRKSIAEVESTELLSNTLNVSKENLVKERKSIEKPDSGNESQIKHKGRKSTDQTQTNDQSSEEIISQTTSTNVNSDQVETPTNLGNEQSEGKFSDSSLSMIKDLDKKPKHKSSLINKSTSALDNPNSFQSKRQRTMSWTITSLSQESDGVFFSDSEISKKKIKKRTSKEFKRQSDHTGSGDSENNIVSDITDGKTFKSRVSKEYSSPKKMYKSDNNLCISETISPQGNKENILVTANAEISYEPSAQFFEKAPTAKLQSTVFFEDSDTDSKDKRSVRMNSEVDTEDQCVPVVDNQLGEKNAPVESDSIADQKNDNSCEPMDIDETIPNNVSIDISLTQEKSNKSIDSKEQKQALSSPSMDKSINKSSNKSKRKSSLSNTQNLEKSETENKSTLILSQLKDVSSTDHNVSKSPKLSTVMLSKSVGSIDIGIEKTLDKKNVSQDYSTSTPLQQKKFQKLGMHINSSIIDTSNIEHKKPTSNKSPKKEISSVSKSSSSEEESDLEDEENSSKNKSNLLDDEADVASDDYESGDSRDDDERQYEDENEIVEKGETLDSDDDVSNDTDYEKDSFIVSSDEEDNELLSGSGDDLSMSNNELSMSKKSKKKYNERKQKEQKNASREMFESRHKLNQSGEKKSAKLKKRQQIDSSSDDSEQEVAAPAKRNKHLRLDSTNDDLDKSSANDSLIRKKPKVKRLSESIGNESVAQEQEISAICENSVNKTSDPLSVHVKLEPKTPMKDVNISTVHINEDIEEVQVDNDVSIMKGNEENDPLQATMMGDEDSSLSENSEIMNNYDSVLNELNFSNKPKTLKSLDMSLNLNKKAKNAKEPIIDQLNLTKTKKKNKALPRDEVDSSKLNKSQNNQNVKTADITCNSSSDSIDLKLLFSEDSNTCDDNGKTAISQKDSEDVEDFIPLKRTPGKMNMLISKDKSEISAPQSPVTGSTKKKNKQRKSQNDNEDLLIDDQKTNDDIQIIVDTQGTHESVLEPSNVSLTNSSKKKRNSISCQIMKNEDSAVNDDDDAPVEVPYESTKKKKKNRKSSGTMDIEGDDASLNVSSILSSAKKNKKRVSESQSSEQGEQSILQPEIDIRGSAKKQKNPVVPQKDDDENVCESSLNVSMKSKKKKRFSETLADENMEAKDNTLPSNVSFGSTKKNKSLTLSESTHLQTDDTSPPQLDQPKKRKRKSSANQVADSIENEDQGNIQNTSKLNVSSSHGSQKKKMKISHNDDDNVPMQVADTTAKKNNKKRKEREDDIDDSVSKIFKQNSFDKVSVTRLPASLLNKLEEQPRKEELEQKKSSVISTTAFVVEDTRKRRNKPSKFLEESVYLNDADIEKKPKGLIKKPKVLPFTPTAVTSGSGFTTNFKINIIPREVKFVAQTQTIPNFKNEYMYGKKIKRLGTYETFKKHRNAKLSKF